MVVQEKGINLDKKYPVQGIFWVKEKTVKEKGDLWQFPDQTISYLLQLEK